MSPLSTSLRALKQEILAGPALPVHVTWADVGDNHHEIVVREKNLNREKNLDSIAA